VLDNAARAGLPAGVILKELPVCDQLELVSVVLSVNTGVVDTPVAPDAGVVSVGALGTEAVVKVWIVAAPLVVFDPAGSMA
jgi:hypothetical protein